MTIVISFSEYGEDDAFWIVRLFAGLVLDTITRGYRSMKNVATVAAIAKVVIANAHPSRSSRMSHATANDAITAAVGVEVGDGSPIQHQLRPDREDQEGDARCDGGSTSHAVCPPAHVSLCP